MAIAVIAALLIHVVWIVRGYTHTQPETARKVRSVAAFGSLALTIVLFVLIQREITGLLALYLPAPASLTGFSVP